MGLRYGSRWSQKLVDSPDIAFSLFVAKFYIWHILSEQDLSFIYYLCQINMKMTYAESLLACLLDCRSNSRPLQNIYMICVRKQTTTMSLDHLCKIAERFWTK